MTRLRTADIDDIAAGLPEYDRHLESLTGLSLAALAREAAGCDGVGDEPATSFCVVPVSSGQGIIPRFSETVRDILVHIGFNAAVSPEQDEDGLAYARDSEAAVTMWADDTRFVAELLNGEKIDNTEATALGYVTGLDLMAKGVAGRPVLLLGCGPLGRAAAGALLARGARLTAFDRVAHRAGSLASRTGLAVAASFEQALSGHDLIIDATDSPDIIDVRHVSSRTYASAPGMPCGITPAAKRLLPRRLLHDPLQLGVAVMAFIAHKRHMTGGARTL